MAEEFSLRTAANLLPSVDDTENTTKQLIDAIELYDGLLNVAGKKLLTTFVLKTKLSQSAKLRLESNYNSNADLIKDIKANLLTKKSAAALSNELHNARQLEKSIDEFGKSLEDLLVNLTLAQADGDSGAVKILRVANEKIAINAFANGLRNHELRTVIKARNYAKLKDAISGAKDEEISKKASSSAQVFHTRNKSDSRQNNAYRGNSRSNKNNRGSYRNNSNHTNRNNNYNSRNSNYNNQNNRQRDNDNFRGRNNGRYNNRNQRSDNNRYNQNNNNQGCNVIGSGENRENGSTSRNSNNNESNEVNTFFRS
ncbi:putative uncharacterized protein DDB_G0286901 [Diorhabda carinulata]|uniref:putative uncharacterized protein DDB_G0286901 n=1 Tax=Diorhabda carinulata TaxID=1163345 RepID=UPI0025A104CE|nr:putative uncharacterized protein DDB_G0286901 [Diorhabda carinulata]